DNADTAEVLLDEAPLRNELWDFGIRILELSLVLSLVTAALVYLSLHWLLVRPMRRITASMVEFRDDPEDASRVIAASRRRDAIDRAIALCTRTLDFSREDTPPLARSRFPLAPLIDEIGPGLAISEHDLAIEDAIPPDLIVEADRDQLYRVFLNLARNAVEA